MTTKRCTGCQAQKPLSDFRIRQDRGLPTSRCKPCITAYQRHWRRSQPDYEKRRYQAQKVEVRGRHLVRKYGVTLADYEAMLASQGGRCAICKTTPDTQRYNVFHVDHCHSTGRVRGLLCRGCNNMLGVIGDDPEALRRAIAYLTVPQIPELIGRAILEAGEAA